MVTNILVDKKSPVPAYRQIIKQITSMIHEGRLHPGDKLPTERELASQLNLARGTVKKAYEVMSRDGIIETTQGRGTFVSSRQDIIPSGRKERAQKIIDNLLDQLRGMNFSYQEIRTFFELAIIQREEKLENFNVAVVDCNPESLSIFERQLIFLKHVRVSRFLLDEIVAEPEAERRLQPFDLILTTSTHYSELLGKVPALKDRLIQMAVSPSQETIIEMAGLSPVQRLGVVCESQNFLARVVARLKDMGLATGSVPCLFLKDENKLPAFLANLDVVFVPPGYQLQRQKENMAAVQEFTQRGGKVITFDYQIERGSLLYVEERISQLLTP
ncbi:MAG: GntR family transcriptional regulator [Candidatus Saccharicenans sp.]|jgi:DNA-binding transcriptional regulator YhcF (GntR family)|nr:GntR family transcriptional regulator [Candidatus Saccharicenans sp.]